MSSGAYTNNTRAVVPWKELTLVNNKYLGEGSLPEGMVLCEPSKLQQYAVINMWNHWKKKQILDQPGLTFIHAREQDRRLPPLMKDKKGKKKAVAFMNPSRSPTPVNTFFPTPTMWPSGIQRSASPEPRQADPHWAEPRREESDDDGHKDGHEDDDEDEDKELALDLDCPKAHMLTKKGRFLYLKTLSTEGTYSAMLKAMERIKVYSNLTIKDSC